jgi:hypothetical protein
VIVTEENIYKHQTTIFFLNKVFRFLAELSLALELHSESQTGTKIYYSVEAS